MHTAIRLLSLCFLVQVGAEAATLTGSVVRVVDGDTIVVLGPANAQHRVRLAAIDTPERGQPYGKKAKEHLSELVAGRPVVVTYEKRDRYGRIVGKVSESGRDVGLEQIRAGLAWHYKRYQGEQTPADRTAYTAAEAAARDARRGLWRDPAPLAPWEWRRRGRERSGTR